MKDFISVSWWVSSVLVSAYATLSQSWAGVAISGLLLIACLVSRYMNEIAGFEERTEALRMKLEAGTVFAKDYAAQLNAVTKDVEKLKISMTKTMIPQVLRGG